MIFTIDSENNITAVGTDAAIPENAQQFGSEKELSKLAADWPPGRLVEIWNSLPGVKPVKKFTTRNTAAGRIWKAPLPHIGNGETGFMTVVPYLRIITEPTATAPPQLYWSATRAPATWRSPASPRSCSTRSWSIEMPTSGSFLLLASRVSRSARFEGEYPTFR